MADPQPQPQPPAPAPLKLGRRAQLTQDVLLAASSRVIKVLESVPLSLSRRPDPAHSPLSTLCSDKAMRQCFPQRWADDYPDLIPALSQLVVDTYTRGVPVRLSLSLALDPLYTLTDTSLPPPAARLGRPRPRSRLCPKGQPARPPPRRRTGPQGPRRPASRAVPVRAPFPSPSESGELEHPR